MSRPRLKDIADQTGFSVATVQRALGAPHLLAKRTRERIVQKMEELGYVPDKNAAGLVTNSTGFIGLVVSSLTSSTFADTIQGVADHTRSIGGELLLAQTSYDTEREYDVIRSIFGRRPDGIILTFSPQERKTRTMLKRAGTPVVETWDLPKRPVDMVAGISNDGAGRQVAQYFARKGYKLPVFFGQLIGRDIARWEAFAAEFTRLTGRMPIQLPVGSGQSISEEDFDQGEGLLDRIGAMSRRVDSVFCASDITATAVVFSAIRRGLRVPKDLAVCGFGNLRFARAMVPSLTTVVVPGYDMGRSAGALIQEKLSGSGSASKQVHETTIVERDTA